jgi:hypothetical protein
MRIGAIKDQSNYMIEQHEREVTGIDWSKPSPEPHKLSHRIPGWDEIPQEFRSWGTIGSEWIAKVGIDQETASNHLDYILNSWEYAVEHKIAALRWLHFLWFEEESHPETISR